MRIDRSHDLLKRRKLNFFRTSFSAIIKFSKMVEEMWKPIKGFEEYYEVSNQGRVKSLYREESVTPKNKRPYIRIKKEKIMTCSLFSCGYRVVSLFSNGKHKKISVHRLVAEAFIENPRQLTEVDHINTDRSDNRVENLRWVTRSENHLNPISRCNHSAAARKSYRPPKKKYVRHSRITPKNAHSVVQLDLSYNFISKYASACEAERKTGTPKKCISMCCKKRMTTSNGYVWLYEEDYNNNNYIKKSLNANAKRAYSKKILQYTIGGKYIRDWDSISEASRTLGINVSHITQCCKGRKKQCGGFIWRYMCMVHTHK